MERRQKVLDYLDRTGIPYEYYEHPEAPTIEIARQYWHDDGSQTLQEPLLPQPQG